MRYAMSVDIGILVGLLISHSVEANFSFDALVGGVLQIVYGREGPANAAHDLEIMTRTTGDRIKHHGYPYEKHVITTNDGYMLEMHRIPNRKTNGSKNVPIIMAPGLTCDSGVYVINGGEDSPAFIFWNDGYDVWLHNNRGARYGRKHKTLSPDFQKEFWNFSFHEMGIYDFPAAIDYVTSTTKSKQVYLLGHSMGGTTTAVFLAEKPDYRAKVKAAFLLSPGIHVKWEPFLLDRALTFMCNIGVFFMGEVGLFPCNNTLLLVANFLESPIGTKWRLLLNEALLCPRNTNDPFLEKISKFISGTSGKVLRHFLQLSNQKRFTRFDYGAKDNMAAYGMETPPDYRLDAIEVPVSVFYGDGDTFVLSKDILSAAEEFKHLISLTRVGDEKFDHLDFLISEHLKFQLYNTILAQMSQLESDGP